MKKILILILAILPLFSSAQHSSVTGRPLVIYFDESSKFKNFIVPPGTWLYIYNIYSDAELVKLKVTVKEKLSANQSAFSKSLIFTRQDLIKFSQNSIFFPGGSIIEYDGIPVIVFCTIQTMAD